MIKVNENQFYEQAMEEIENGTQVKALWAKSFAKAEGDKEKSKALYINIGLKS